MTASLTQFRIQGETRFLQQRVVSHLATCKTTLQNHELPIAVGDAHFVLRPMAAWCLEQPELIRHLTEWRKRNQMAFPSIFNVTFAGTLAWFKQRVVEDPERLLFGVFDAHDCLVAHAGLATFDWTTGDCEIDNVMRGDDAAPKGLMTAVVRRLVAYAYQELGLQSVSLRVFGDNWRAIKLYQNCGFLPVESLPVECVFTATGVNWKTCSEFVSGKTVRIFLRMKHESASSHVT
jgi:RimJ/RimL family protein N-acetyltransferase